MVLYANGNFGTWPLSGGPATKVTPLLTGVATSAGNVAVLAPLEVAIPVATLSTETFTHLSIPFSPDLYGTDGPQDTRGAARVLALELVTASPAQNKPLVTLNDVRWTP